jgi:Late embryogenesis abundant (LEA) group 1
MQAGKNAMETVKEKAANVGASAKAGMDKTKAVVEEKVFLFVIVLCVCV